MFKANQQYDEPEVHHDHPHKRDEVETVVGPSVVVEGDFASEGNILVKGTVSGNVKTGMLLTVEEGAKILANVRAGEAVISGEVKGNVRASGRVELTGSAQVLGDISCTTLVVEAGALLHGKVNMKGVDIDKDIDKKVRKTRTKTTSGEDDKNE